MATNDDGRQIAIVDEAVSLGTNIDLVTLKTVAANERIRVTGVHLSANVGAVFLLHFGTVLNSNYAYASTHTAIAVPTGINTMDAPSPGVGDDLILSIDGATAGGVVNGWVEYEIRKVS